MLRRRSVHCGGDPLLRFRRGRASGGRERRSGAAPNRARVLGSSGAGAHGSRRDRVSCPHPALRSVPLAAECPSRGVRDEPARKQGPFEGSFRQRRATTLRRVADAAQRIDALDDEAVRSLERDGLVVVEEGLVGSSRLDQNGVQHPDVRLDVRADPVLDEERRETTREDVLAVCSGTPCPSTRASRTSARWIDHRPRAGPMISPPTRSWILIQGSKCAPSPRRQSM